MLTPEYLNSLSVEILELYTLLDESIARAIARRLVRMGFASDSTVWQVNKLQEAGLLYEDVIALVAKYLPASEKAVKSVFSSAAIKSLEFDNAIFEAAGLTPIAFRQSPAMTQQLIAGLNRTNGTLKNLTLTTANTAQTAYIQACDLAHMQVSSGAMDYITAIKEAVMSASSEGAKILYPSGHTDQLDVAVRRATLTGVSQTTGELSLMNAQEMGCDLMEITAHSDARPDHAAWQGKIVSLSGADGYLSLDDIGYGTGAGFKGWNCRHDWYPFFEGISHRMYSDEKLKEWENNPVPYEDSQRQRAMERDIRKTKRELAGLDEAIKNAPNDEVKSSLEAEFRKESVRLKSQESKMKAFCKEKDLLVQNERVQVQGFGRSQAQKAVHADKRNYDSWKNSVGGDSFPKTVAEYRAMKYNNPTEYELIQSYVKSVNSGMLSPLAKYSNYKNLHDRIDAEIVNKVTVNGIKITGQSKHFMERVIGTISDSKTKRSRNGVSIEEISDALFNGQFNSIKTDKKGSASVLLYNDVCGVSVNPHTGQLIQCNPRKK